MKSLYEKSFTELIELIRDSRDDCVRRTEEFIKSKNSVLNLGDARFISYSNMVGTSEMRAMKVVERLAVALIEDISLSFLMPNIITSNWNITKSCVVSPVSNP